MAYSLVFTTAKPYVAKGLWVETEVTDNKTILNLMMYNNEIEEAVTVFEVHITKEKDNG